VLRGPALWNIDLSNKLPKHSYFGEVGEVLCAGQSNVVLWLFCIHEKPYFSPSRIAEANTALSFRSAIASWLCEKEQKRISGENGVLLVDLSELLRDNIAYSVINFGIAGNRNKVLHINGAYGIAHKRTYY
jgi:hypothetical protein